MAPERVAKRFRKMYGRCGRIIDGFEDDHAHSVAMMSKLSTIWSRWRVLAEDESYCQELLDAGIKPRVMAKQALVLEESTAALEEAMEGLDRGVKQLRNLVREAEHFVRGEYGRRCDDIEEGEAVLTLSTKDYVAGLRDVLTMLERAWKVKKAALEEIRAQKGWRSSPSQAATKEEAGFLSSLFEAPPGLDLRRARGTVEKGLA